MAFLGLVLLVGRCPGQDEAEVPKRQVDQPDHLVPIDPYPGDWHESYAKLYRKTLQLPEPGEAAVMVYMPSFSGEEGLVIHETEGKDPSFILIHTRADRNIWYSMPENSDDGKPKRVVVTRREAPLPAETAWRVCRLWERMLRGVRYPIPAEEDSTGLDGETIEFWRHNMYGTTWSPEGGALRGLLDLGRALADYCEVSEDKRAATLKTVQGRCQALERYLEVKAAPR
ncbi:hypothetical protein OJF2_44200 [Aquisphaera giovannonii]|uniref:Tyrosinase copper-binding domain-containing protein n=1 Tax=Aquisphaera giovannonii TaxID=406548 RepID=A0A5B9W5J0_9BACT|nr:hypothetical protein [Aquisphaera giovannonii]QEH35863.1 hypothetical protein OJF2_44200 [Aquisphaera giovannonii]